MPRRPLPDEGGEDEGVIGGEVWETPATLDTQREFYTAPLDEVDNYTRAAEVTQQTLRSLASTQQQRVQAKIRKRTQELQEQLEWAEKALDPQAISDAKLERAFRPQPRHPESHQDGRGSRCRHQAMEGPTPTPLAPAPESPDLSPP